MFETRKNGLIEGYVVRRDDFLRVEVENSVVEVVIHVSNEHSFTTDC